MYAIFRAAMCVIAVLLWLAVTPVSQATMIFSTGVNSQTPPQAGLSLSGRTGANSFTVGPAQIVAVSLYTLECCDLIWNGSIDYFLFQNSGFTPASSAFAQGQASSWNATTIYSDNASNRVIRYDFNLTSPVSVNAGTYWLGITLTDAFFFDPSWNLAVPLAGFNASTAGTDFTNWGLGQGTGAFALFDTPFAIPEPGAGSLAVLGLVAVALRRRTKRS